ncbi:MAG TPA: electron transporter RnfE [Cyanobacteria bacterium UBA8530]|nr:electron transporter RnfE [Cyanobacteria bacterium UBA8530]
MGLMMLFGSLFWIALLVLIVLAIMRLWPQATGLPGREDEARSLLRQRYARGEIDKGEYEEKMRDLSS